MLTPDQRDRLKAEAEKRGIDPNALIAEAEKMSDDEPAETKPVKDGGASSSTEQPKLFMYLLPFVTVREVRQKWLGLTDSFAGDGEVASKWAAKQGGESAPAPDAATE